MSYLASVVKAGVPTHDQNSLLCCFRCDANYILLAATTIIPVSMVLIPFCKMLVVLAIVLAVMGVNMGIIDCLANVQMIKIFGDAVPPFLQV
jgi:predicted membrane channel-forming protein YqfA (hemolysin III family)